MASKTSTKAEKNPSPAGMDWGAQFAQLDNVKPAEQMVEITTDPAAAARLNGAQQGYDLVVQATYEQVKNGPKAPKTEAAIWRRVNNSPRVRHAEALRDQAKQKVEQSVVRLWFRGLERTDYEELLAQHPPSPEDQRQGRKYHPDGFAPALVSACHVHKYPDPAGGTDDDGEPLMLEAPGMTVEQADRLLRKWTAGDAGTVFSVALAVNEVTRIDFGGTGKG